MRRTARAVASLPSRRKKKSKNRVRPTSTTTPSTPAKKAPLESRRRVRSDLPPSKAQPRIRSGGTGTNLASHWKNWSRAGICRRSLG
jgi:hypothetical protein